MSDIVTKIARIDSTGGVLVTLDFFDYEVLSATAVPVQPSRFDRNQDNKPTLFTFGDAWYEIPISFRVHDQTTMTKLGQIRDGVKSGALFRVHPVLLDDPGMYFDCSMSPNVPLFFSFSGRLVVGETVPITFVEMTRDYQYTFTDDVGDDAP